MPFVKLGDDLYLFMPGLTLQVKYMKLDMTLHVCECLFQQPRGLRCGSAGACLLGLRDRMFASYDCCVL